VAQHSRMHPTSGPGQLHRPQEDFSMNAELQTLKARLEQLEARSEQAEQRYLSAQRRLRAQAALAFVAVTGAILVSPANRTALAQGYGITLQQVLNRVIALETRATNLETKTKFVSIGADGEMHVVGTNLHIENGLGATNGEPSNPYDYIHPIVNGKGNLI